MNEVLKTIRDRRSVRSFRPEQITDDELKTILEAGLYAPSGNNAQSWFFSAVQNPALIESINGWIVDEARFSSHPKAQQIATTPNSLIFRKAPTVVIVSGQKSDPLAAQNCACAAQNMMLAAQSLGIGSCWICYVEFLSTSKKLAEYRSALRIPEGYDPFFGLTFGYKAEPDQPPQPRRKGVIALFR